MSSMFEENFERSIEFAKKNFLTNKTLPHSIMLGWDKEDISVIVVFIDYDDATRDHMKNILDSSIKQIQKERGVEGQPDWFIQMAESWIVRIDNDDIPKEENPLSDIRPSEHPDRTEALIVYGSQREGEGRSWVVDIYREPNLHLGEPNEEEMSDVKARIVDLLWGNHNEMNTPKSFNDVFRDMMGENPSEKELMECASGWISATVKSPLGELLPENIRRNLLKAANIMKGDAEKR